MKSLFFALALVFTNSAFAAPLELKNDEQFQNYIKEVVFDFEQMDLEDWSLLYDNDFWVLDLEKSCSVQSSEDAFQALMEIDNLDPTHYEELYNNYFYGRDFYVCDEIYNPPFNDDNDNQSIFYSWISLDGEMRFQLQLYYIAGGIW